jgi:tetratricopeptide (TPR) repeat protein
MRWLILLVLLSPIAAWAQSKTKAREAYRRASQHYDLGEYTQALEAFKEAYRNYEEPSFLFNIAQCHRQLGEQPQAVKMYRSYLTKVPDAPNAEEVRQMLGKLERAIADQAAAKNAPPAGTLKPDPTAEPHSTAPPQSSVVAETVARPPKTVPAYRRWWVWTVVGGGVALGVGLGVGLGLGLSQPAPGPTAQTDLGTYKPVF